MTFLPSMLRPPWTALLAASGELKVMNTWATFWWGLWLAGLCIQDILLIELGGRSDTILMLQWWRGLSASRVMGMNSIFVLKEGSRILVSGLKQSINSIL